MSALSDSRDSDIRLRRIQVYKQTIQIINKTLMEYELTSD